MSTREREKEREREREGEREKKKGASAGEFLWVLARTSIDPSAHARVYWDITYTHFSSLFLTFGLGSLNERQTDGWKDGQLSKGRRTGQPPSYVRVRPLAHA